MGTCSQESGVRTSLAPVSELVQWNRIPKRPVSEGYQNLVQWSRYQNLGFRTGSMEQDTKAPAPVSELGYQNLGIRTWFNGTGYQGADIRTWVTELGSMVAGPKVSGQDKEAARYQ